jgi:hypothetical protein
MRDIRINKKVVLRSQYIHKFCKEKIQASIPESGKSKEKNHGVGLKHVLYINSYVGMTIWNKQK